MYGGYIYVVLEHEMITLCPSDDPISSCVHLFYSEYSLLSFLMPSTSLRCNNLAQLRDFLRPDCDNMKVAFQLSTLLGTELARRYI